MKKLQNNFTTPEQSKRLLKLGVPADSADMYYHLANHQYYVRDEFSIKQHDFFEFYKNIFYPCWSVGRLMEIITICHIGEDGRFNYVENVIDSLVYVFENFTEFGEMDFSKLEE